MVLRPQNLSVTVLTSNNQKCWCSITTWLVLYRLMTWSPGDSVGDAMGADTPSRDFRRSESTQSVHSIHSQNSILSQDTSNQKIPNKSQSTTICILLDIIRSPINFLDRPFYFLRLRSELIISLQTP